MRDPDRIPDVLEKVADIWRRNPDLRLMQLLMNCCDYSSVDMYNLEDFDLVKRLNDLYKEEETLEDIQKDIDGMSADCVIFDDFDRREEEADKYDYDEYLRSLDQDDPYDFLDDSEEFGD